MTEEPGKELCESRALLYTNFCNNLYSICQQIRRPVPTINQIPSTPMPGAVAGPPVIPGGVPAVVLTFPLCLDWC